MPAPSLYDAQSIFSNAGLRTQYGVILPPGARVAAYVRSTGQQSGDDTFLTTNLVATLAAGLARVRAGLGDFVVCLPGHVESVADATTFSAALVAGTKIIGVGRGSNMPTFTWTATAAQWLVAVADVQITGIRMLLDGINGVVLALNVTAADFGLQFCDIEVSTTAKAVTTAIAFTATATRADISGNVFRGLASQPATTIISITGSLVDGIRISDNEMLCPAGAASGIINISGTPTNLKILRNVMANTTAASVAAINIGNSASITGQVSYNTIGVLNTGALVSGTTGITIGAAVAIGFFQNFVVNDVVKSGLLLPTADA